MEGKNELKKLVASAWLTGVRTVIKNWNYWKNMSEDQLLKHLKSLADRYGDETVEEIFEAGEKHEDK